MSKYLDNLPTAVITQFGKERRSLKGLLITGIVIAGLGGAYLGFNYSDKNERNKTLAGLTYIAGLTATFAGITKLECLKRDEKTLSELHQYFTHKN